MKLNDYFWDCECEKHYIKPATQKTCRICKAYKEDCPNSRQNEIEETFPYWENLQEIIKGTLELQKEIKNKF